ncbi:MAG: hypothetical protein KIH08_03030 [Candidatus Freyarchaeota archaeon]|nr:hypothetical protein [Candidatus Jordarchaeia archaeon]MBS7267733.1 hypothetical protein [Candidatus Jordarchaeia archaeon]MBS7281420.1 hypothetical protein [Candidatus Jordarchaeia archaeon]
MLRSIAEILVSCLGFSYEKPCRYLMVEEGKLTRCALDYSVPICKGVWCEPITEELMITTCDKLADVARSIPNKLSSGVTDLDLHLAGGLQFADHVAVIGEPRTTTYLAIHIVVAASKRNIKAYYYTTSKGARLNTVRKMVEKIGVESCIIGDIAEVYKDLTEDYLLISKFKEMLEESRKEGYEGLLVIRDSILRYMKEEALFPKKILECEERLSRVRIRNLLTISIFESELVEKEIRDFIMDTFSTVIETRDSPPSFRILKREQGRPSPWVNINLTVP